MLKHILVALDDSDIADRVMQSVHQLILPSDGKIILCHVFPTSNAETEHPADRPYSESSAISYLQVEKQLQSYQAELPVDSDLELVNGNPAEEIIRLANIHQADLIVIGSRGLTGMTRIVQGSVSSQVVEEAHCSVWVVKPG
ncbi:UspA domain-containing protein [Calothrix sp. NIES-4101]|nr:UspA domain-containing protein [Calothrix sp. NIES-4101]